RERGVVRDREREPIRERGDARRDRDRRRERFAIGVMLERADRPDAEGQLLIREVFPDSPAANAGLEDGDVILKVDENPVTRPAEITRRVRRAGIDDQTLSLEISRNDETLTVEVKP